MPSPTSKHPQKLEKSVYTAHNNQQSTHLSSQAPSKTTQMQQQKQHPPYSLTLTRPLASSLSPRKFLHTHLNSKPSIRPSGRKPSQSRPVQCNTGSLPHCTGSSVIRTGDTAVVCGIQTEILKVEDIADHPESEKRVSQDGHSSSSKRQKTREETNEEQEALEKLHLLVPNVEVATGCSPAYLPGSAPGTEVQALSQRLYRLLLSSKIIDLDDLRIWSNPSNNQSQRSSTSSSNSSLSSAEDEPVDRNDLDDGFPTTPQIKAYYTLYITILPLSLDSGLHSLLDAAFTSLIASLRDIRFPGARWDDDTESVICSPLVSESKRLNLRSAPICLNCAVFGERDIDVDPSDMIESNGNEEREEMEEDERGMMRLKDGKKAWLLEDPDEFEERVCEEGVSLVVDCSGGKTRVLSVEKRGGGVVGAKEMAYLIERAGNRWAECMNTLPNHQQQ